MRAGGMSDQAAGYACDILSLYVQAQALEMALFLERAGNSEEKMLEFFHGVDDATRRSPRSATPTSARSCRC